MTQVTPIDFVTRAVSLDEGRYNMTSAYREKDRLVATDGHRLHMVSGLVNQDKGGFVDGRDAEFPNYEMVLPKSVKEIGIIKFTKKEIAHLNKVVKLFRERNCSAKFEFQPNTPLVITAQDKGEHDSFTLTLTFPNVEISAAHTVGLNLRYFVEALIPNMPMKFSADGERGPQLVELDYGSGKYTGLIMPLRLEF